MHNKRIFLCIILLCFLAATIYRSPRLFANHTEHTDSTTLLDWFFQCSEPTGSDLYGVSFVNENIATAVGEGGTILRSEDGGLTWSEQASGTTTCLYGVYFADPDTGTLVGDGGEILRTTNAGNTWFAQESGTAVTLKKIIFFDTNTGIGIGDTGTILRTVNGGDEWNIQVSGTVNDLCDISFINAKTGLVVGYGGTILRTDDGGITWIDKPGAFGTCVSLVDSLNGVVVGEVTYGTADGGNTWDSLGVNCVPFQCYTINDICMENVTSGFSVGSYLFMDPPGRGTIRRTDNGGEDWTEVGKDLNSYYDISFGDANNGLAVGQAGQVNRTTDGGASWQVISSHGLGNELVDVSFVDTDNGWVSGYFLAGPSGNDKYYIIWRTANGGTSWGGVYDFAPNYKVPGVSFFNADVGAVAGYDNTSGFQGFVVFTEDGGDNWSWIRHSGERLYDVAQLDENTITAVGRNGTILRTPNRGGSWAEQTSGTPNDLYGVSFVDLSWGWVVGDIGTIVRTSNGGDDWTVQTSGTTVRLNGVSFVDASTGTVVGANGTILRTINGGDTWDAQTSGVTDNLEDVSFVDANTGAAAGAGGTILYTTDGGINWTRQITREESTLNAIWMINGTVGTAVGMGGVILRSEGAITAVVIAGFHATPVDNGIALNWSIIADERVEEFRIYRFDPPSKTEYQINDRLIGPAERTYVDKNAIPGERYRYTLAVLGVESGEVRSEAVEAELAPRDVRLYQNKPNPFNPATTIRYMVPRPSPVQLQVFSVSGHLVRTLIDEFKPAGSHETIWDGTNNAGIPVASGVYVCRLHVGKVTRTSKITLLK